MSKATLLKSTTQAPAGETAPAPRRRTVDMRAPLSVRERARKEQLEGIVIGNFKAFYEVGCALREIRDTGLYRETHKTFEHYSKQLFDIARAEAYRLISAADVVENVSQWETKSDPDFPGQIAWAPANERQARALVGLPPEQQAEVWAEAVRTAKDGKITAAHVKRTRRKIYDQEIDHEIQRAKNSQTFTDPETIMSPEFESAFKAFLDQVNVARLEKWQKTSKFNVIRYLVGITKAIAGNDDVGMIFGLRDPGA